LSRDTIEEHSAGVKAERTRCTPAEAGRAMMRAGRRRPVRRRAVRSMVRRMRMKMGHLKGRGRGRALGKGFGRCWRFSQRWLANRGGGEREKDALK
jgi:hypothetical protein